MNNIKLKFSKIALSEITMKIILIIRSKNYFFLIKM